MGVAGVAVDQRAIDVVGPDGGECADVARHARHEAGDHGRYTEPQQAGAEIARHHQRQHFIIAVPAGHHGFVLGQQRDARLFS